MDEQLARLAPPPPVEEVPWHFPGSDLRRAREAEAAYATEVDRATAELGRARAGRGAGTAERPSRAACAMLGAMTTAGVRQEARRQPPSRAASWRL